MFYYDYTDSAHPMQCEADALDLVGGCMERGTYLLMLHEDSVSKDFFDLATGLAGAALLKFSLYGLQVALVCDNKKLLRGRFGEFMMETNKGRDFRIYPTEAEALAWLTAQR